VRNLLIVAVMAAMVFVGCEGDDNPTAPPDGSCCAVNGTCMVTTQVNCTGTSIWTVGGVCEPNPCAQPDGSCCAVNGTCTVTTQAACTGTSAWIAGGVCEPNSCVQPDGACCALDGTCTVTKLAACTDSTWTMFGVCSPNPCPPPVSNYLPQTSPANVIANLQIAYGERTIDEYRKLFTEDFIFVFSPTDLIDPNHQTPPQWGLGEELVSTENMFTDELVFKIELSSYVLGVPTRVDSVEYRPRAWKVRIDRANLQVYTRKPDGTLLTLLVDGATEVFYFVEEPSRPSPINGRPTWYIFRWEDQPIGSGKTEVISWGQVKALFR
jgi:hypothetical protein